MSMIPVNRKFLRGDIYYANLEPHLGSEQGGIRPVVVVQNNHCKLLFAQPHCCTSYIQYCKEARSPSPRSCGR